MIRSCDIEKMIDRVAIGNRVRQCRKAMGLRLVDLKERSGIDDATINMIELGQRRGTMQCFVALALALGKPLEWILSGERTLRTAWKRQRQNQAA